MFLKSFLKKTANFLLTSLGLEIKKMQRHSGSAITMDKALSRLIEHNFFIQTIIDVGAHSGIWSKLAMQYFPKVHFLAFEPLEEKRKELDDVKIAHNNFDYVLAVAGAEQGQACLNVTEDLSGSTVSDSSSGNSRKVPMTTLDLQIREKGLRGPFLIKLDTHGYELPILSGSEETLKDTKVVIMEVYNFDLTEKCQRFYDMCLYMDSLGFRVYDMADPMLRPRDKLLWQMDLFFIPKDSYLFECEGYK